MDTIRGHAARHTTNDTGRCLFAGLAAISQTYASRNSYIRTGLSIGLVVVVMLCVMMKSPLGREAVIELLWIASGAGVAWLIFTRSRAVLPITFVALAQIAVIITILPKSRYFLFSVPFLAIAIAAALQALIGKNQLVCVWQQCWC
jgi:hypothetical protein